MSIPKALTLLIVLLTFSCASNKKTLRIGVTADYPPIIFKQGNTLSGMDVDFANAICKELNRNPEFVEISWQELIPALQKGKIDIIMSGMSITPERSSKVAFVNPYFSVIQMLLIRKRDFGKFKQPGKGYYINSNLIIGVSKGTTGETLAKKHLPKYRMVPYDKLKDGIDGLRRGKIDCFLHDSPTIWSYSNGKDPQITGIYWQFSEEKLAWAVSRENLKLRSNINKVLDKWRFDSTRSKIISKWVPHSIIYKR